MHRTIYVLILFICTSFTKAQLSREDVKEILLIEEYQTENLDKAADELHRKYLDKISYEQTDLLNGIFTSSLSGIGMGVYQSRTANYQYSNWLPQFIEQWWNIKPQTDMVLGKSVSWQKVFKEIDYIFDRKGYENLNRFFGGKWYYSYITHAFIKNLSAALIRHKFKYGRFF